MSERENPVKVFTELHKKYYNADLIFEGKIPPGDDDNDWLWIIVAELINNCVENRLPNSDAHASWVKITFEKEKVTVEDNFIYEKPQVVLEQILAIRDSGRPQTTKTIDEDLGIPWGGMGIYFSQLELQERGGKLDYYIKDGTIVAVASWDTSQ